MRLFRVNGATIINGGGVKLPLGSVRVSKETLYSSTMNQRSRTKSGEDSYLESTIADNGP